MYCYSLFDRKLREFGNILISNNDASVMRMLLDAMRGSRSLPDLHPEDFDLFVLGEFDVSTGVLVGSPPRLVANLQDLYEEVPNVSSQESNGRR